MITDFRQGIISYPHTSDTQSFLEKDGTSVNLVIDGSSLYATVCHRSENYLISEKRSVLGAWTSLEDDTDYWLYIDVHLSTATRTFGKTTIEPVVSYSRPTTPTVGLHWFDQRTSRMTVYESNGFREVIRLFVAKVNNSTFTGLGDSVVLPFAGTQIESHVLNTLSGQIITDGNGKPTRRDDGTFLTTSTLLLSKTASNTIQRTESTVQYLTATEDVTRFSFVARDNEGMCRRATYSDLQVVPVTIALTDCVVGEVLETRIQGVVSNLDWNWSEVGIDLWVDDNGQLTEIDPYTASPEQYSQRKGAVARALSKTSVYLDQGLPTKGDPASVTLGEILPATVSDLGSGMLSVDSNTPLSPVVVTTNDPRMTNARAATTHSHNAAEITTSVYAGITGSNMQLQFNELADQKGSQSVVAQLQTTVDNLNLVDLLDTAIVAPSDGQLITYRDSDNMFIATSLERRISLVWNQVSPTTTWTITHNLNNAYPVLMSFDSTDVNINPGSVNIVDANTIAVTFGTPQSGRVHVLFVSPGNVLEAPPNPTTLALLLNGSGTNGSTTFIDSSPSAHTLVGIGMFGGSGNASISTSTYKYNSGSIIFPNSQSALRVSSSLSGFEFGTKDWTVESWIYYPQLSGGSSPFYMGDTNGEIINLQYGGTSETVTLRCRGGVNISGGYIPGFRFGWHHVAATRESGTVRLFVDGVLKGTASDGTVAYPLPTYVEVNSFRNAGGAGYIDDLRVVSGKAIYTSSFTPPTGQLTTEV